MGRLQLSSDKNLLAIHSIANTSSVFYKLMRDNYFVQHLSSNSSEELIKEFYDRASKPIEFNELVDLYAIYIALTLKPFDEVGSFFKETSKIEFEWFSDIAHYYLNDFNSIPSYQAFSVNPIDVSNEFGVEGIIM